MKLKLILYGLLATSLTVFAAVPAQYVHSETSAAAGSTTILIIRHAEEPSDGRDLSSRGNSRAQAYVDYFKNLKIDGQPLKLSYLFAAKDTENSRRPRLTLEPLAQQLGLTINDRFKDKQTSELADQVRQLRGADILICWRHSEIPGLLRALGADPKTLLHDGKWPGHVFGWMIYLRFDQDGNLLESKRIKEHLQTNKSLQTQTKLAELKSYSGE
jgi:hypothetical protein